LFLASFSVIRLAAEQQKTRRNLNSPWISSEETSFDYHVKLGVMRCLISLLAPC
jgi:hypothetical protein